MISSLNVGCLLDLRTRNIQRWWGKFSRPYHGPAFCVPGVWVVKAARKYWVLVKFSVNEYAWKIKSSKSSLENIYFLPIYVSAGNQKPEELCLLLLWKIERTFQAITHGLLDSSSSSPLLVKSLGKYSSLVPRYLFREGLHNFAECFF